MLLFTMVVVAAVMYATVSEVAVEEPMVSRLESRMVLPTTENANPGGGSDTDEATVGDDEVGGGGANHDCGAPARRPLPLTERRPHGEVVPMPVKPPLVTRKFVIVEEPIANAGQ